MKTVVQLIEESRAAAAKALGVSLNEYKAMLDAQMDDVCKKFGSKRDVCTED